MQRWLIRGKAFLSRKQGSILSAAFLVMAMIAVSRVLGLVRQRVLVDYFSVEELSVYFAAFRLPETIFEILVAGSLASAFIPVFTTLLSSGQAKRAWYVASLMQTVILFAFLLFSLAIFIFAFPLAQILAPGFPPAMQETMAGLTRLLLLAQGFFLLSFFASSTQEATGRFLVPAIAPLFYNLGIIAGAIFLGHLGVWGAAIGAVFGAGVHFAFQVPFAQNLGFRFVPYFNLRDPDFRRIIKLAAPRIIELLVVQITKSVELFLSTLISVASYTFLTFANTLQLFPVALFGYSFAKAALPTMSAHVARNDRETFAKTFHFTISQILFFVVPLATVFLVLRIPLVRLAFGTDRFSWDATVQTGLALSAFTIGTVAQAVLNLVTRSFYALQNTKTPMLASLATLSIEAILAFFFIKTLGFGVWSIALAFSLASLVQLVVLMLILNKKVAVLTRDLFLSVGRIIFAAAASGLVMYLLLKILDRAVWDKNLSFLGNLGLSLPTGFERFVLDTRYTINLIFLTLLVMTVGFLVYFAMSVFFKVREVEILARWVGQILKREAPPVPREATEENGIPLPPGG
ncbi:murein biosynthesis integral membrane protein MurJ [Candidatus Microgenomates bacterium]|nr:murein biosynthesis integral membrane protein MurJ [Candidatus Microgenomates bacterium]